MKNRGLEPLVDVVIPVHDTSRPLQRAVDSLLQSGLEVPRELRISVVCHNLHPSAVEAMLSPEANAAVRLLEFSDGEQSPAGPFMHGIRSATAEFVSIMGSDDTIEPDGIRQWHAAASRMGLTALIPRERHASGAKIATPPVRPWRQWSLDPVRDRLPYRTAPLGLVRRTAVAELGLDMPSRLRTGEDQLFAMKLWFSGRSIGYGRSLPHYVVGADARFRVTLTTRTIDDELRAVGELVTDPWVGTLPMRARRAIATKCFRVHIVSAVRNRIAGADWRDGDADFVRELLRRFSTSAPGYERSLSWADRRLLDELEGAHPDSSRLAPLLTARDEFRSLGGLLARDLRGTFATDGPLRYLIASRLL